MPIKSFELMELFVELIDARANSQDEKIDPADGISEGSYLQPASPILNASPIALAQLDAENTGIMASYARVCGERADDLAELLWDLDALLADPSQIFFTRRHGPKRLSDYVYPVV